MRGNLLLSLTFAIAFGILGHAQQGDGGANSSATAGTGNVVHTNATTTARITLPTLTVGNGTCPSRTANYITHTLPQQCLRTERFNTTTSRSVESHSNSPSTHVRTTGGTSGLSEPTTATQVATESGFPILEHLSVTSEPTVGTSGATSELPRSSTAATSSSSVPSGHSAESEAEADSPLDNAKFLSFEEWKKQNSFKAPEPGRDPREGPDRPRPGINNALDGFGEDGEIELDFSGFGSPASGPRQQQAAYRATDEGTAIQATPTAHSPRSKDAGQTCKERTNYASFDCAATVLKINPECKSAASVLVENKDSYMLNTCTARNKFFIVELCNDILVDTIVLANYEFFSSIFRHFRVSVSDVYPVKLDKWKDLGTFEARNSRDVQAFLIEHPQIWARYLRVEFLTHYGSEYYCPISLLRVHGTTMLEDMRHQEDMAQSETREEIAPEATSVPPEPQEPKSMTEEAAKETVQVVPKVDKPSSPTVSTTSEATEAGTLVPTDPLIAPGAASTKTISGQISANSTFVPPVLDASSASDLICPSPSTVPTGTPATRESRSLGSSVTDPSHQESPPRSESKQYTPIPSNTTEKDVRPDTASPSGPNNTVVEQTTTRTNESIATQPATIVEQPARSQTSNSSSASTSALPASTASNGTARVSSSTASAPAQPQPSTQESFFKSIHKRLQQLEANSTLSLQYIEEQSRILRDAFSKVEKRQISATTSFLTNLNQTVMQELHGFRQAYDQLWQSTVIELEGQREQYQREMLAMSSRLTLVADELVWQKRMGIVQSTLLLLCLGLVLFARAGNTGYLEVPLMQQMMNKSSAALSRAGWESPPVSPSPTSRSPVTQFRRRLWRSVTDPSAGENATEDTASVTDSRPGTKDGPALDVHVEPPTPPNGVAVNGSGEWEDADDEEELLDPRESQSGPSTPRGTRESEHASEGLLDAG